MREKFSSELEVAMKAGEKRRVRTIRMIMAALKYKDIEARGQGKTVSDKVQKMTKSRKESQEIYEKSRPRGPRLARKRGNRDHPGLFAATAKRGGSGAGDRRHRRDQGLVPQGHGERDRYAQGKIVGRMDFAKASALVKRMLGA